MTDCLMQPCASASWKDWPFGCQSVESTIYLTAPNAVYFFFLENSCPVYWAGIDVLICKFRVIPYTEILGSLSIEKFCLYVHQNSLFLLSWPCFSLPVMLL